MPDQIATSEEVAKVRRLECEENGHDKSPIFTWQSRHPVRFVCTRCGETFPAPSGADIETLAEQLHEAAGRWRFVRHNCASPRWFALRDDHKELFRELAAKLLEEWAA